MTDYVTDVVIRDFKMPKTCCFCPFERRKRCVIKGSPIPDCFRKPYTERAAWCPLEAVKRRARE